MDLIHRLKMKLKRPKKVLSLEIDKDRCVGCKRCVSGCKREVFVMDGCKAVVRSFAACVGCGKCVEKMCNFGAIYLVVEKNR